jgi:cell division septation protein DedD
VAAAQDDGFHEIQLNGKQLVFLFMAATVVSVVIFLCGVLVGRGVRAERGAVADNAPVNPVAETTPEPAPRPAAATTTPAGSDPRAAAPPPPVDDLSYFKRLEAQRPAPEQLKASSEKRPSPPERTTPSSAKAAAAAPAPNTAATASKPAAAPPPSAAASEPAASTAPEPSGPGYAVQIAAVNVRADAEAIAKRLSSKGYAAYVMVPSGATPTIFRVRVGKFPTRREAESVAAKLKKEEQFNPWVTR